MKKKNIKHLSLRIDEELLRRFDYVASAEDRSMNWMLLNMIRRAIEEFEAKNGKIDLSDDAD